MANRIERLYVVVKTDERGQEFSLFQSSDEGYAKRDLQERVWSGIQNTGVRRTDLSLVTFERVAEEKPNV